MGSPGRWRGALWIAGMIATASVGELSQAAPACAQTTAAERQRARTLFERGVTAFEQGDYARALDAFRDAYRIRPHPAVLVNIANCYMKLERPIEAARYFERYLRQARAATASDPDRHAEVERALARARVQVARLRVQAPSGTQVFIDGAARGQVPLPAVELNPGPHVVELRHPDGKVETDHVRLQPGSERTFQSESASSDSVPAEHEDPQSTPEHGRTPHGAPPPTGTSTGPAPSRDGEPAARGPLGIPLGSWITGGIAVGALAAAAGFGGKALAQRNEFDSAAEQLRTLPQDDDRAHELRQRGRALADARKTNAIVADVMLVTGLSAAAVAVYWLLRDDGDEARVRVGPAIAPGGAALSVGGRL